MKEKKPFVVLSFSTESELVKQFDRILSRDYPDQSRSQVISLALREFVENREKRKADLRAQVGGIEERLKALEKNINERVERFEESIAERLREKITSDLTKVLTEKIQSGELVIERDEEKE